MTPPHPAHASPAPVALVTGGARRLGAAIARGLHAAGYDVALHYGRSREAAERLAAELEAARAGSVSVLQAELAEFDRLPELIARTVGRFGRLDALVNNASAFFPTPIGEATPGSIAGFSRVQLRSTVSGAQAAKWSRTDVIAIESAPRQISNRLCMH